jgi:integrase
MRLKSLAMARGTLIHKSDRRSDYWILQVEAGRDPVTGKRRRISQAFTGTRRQAETALAELVVEASRGGRSGTTATLGDLLEAWFDHASSHLSPTTAQEYRRLIDRRITPALGHVQLRKLLASDLDAFYRRLSRSGLAPASVRQIHAVIRRALNQAIRWGWLDTNPARRATPPPPRRAQVAPPDPAQVVALIDAARVRNPELATWIYLAAAVGARRGEMAGLRWANVDWDRGEVFIDSAVICVERQLTEKDTKTHAQRRVAIGSGSLAVLKAHRDAMERRANEGGIVLASDAHVFSDDLDGARPWIPNRVTHAFGQLKKACGVTGIRLHDLRHFVATQMTAGGTDVRTGAGRLGHANVATFLNVYSAFVPAADRVAAEHLDQLLNGQGASPAAS